MSLRLFENDVLFIQRLLKAQGLYEGELDGIWGPLTERAAVRFEHRTGIIREQMQTFDLRSESQLSGLLLAAQRAAREFLAHVLDAGILARISPHYQLRTGLSHREVLARFEAGVPYLPVDGRQRDVVA